MAERTSPGDLEQMLARAGVEVSVDEFVHRVGEALAEYRATDFARDPARELDEVTAAHLRAGGLDLSPLRPGENDPVAVTAAEHAALLVDSLSVDEVARTLGVDPSRVRQLLRARGLYGIRTDQGWRVPRLQFADDRQIPGLAVVFAALPESLHPVAVWRFLTGPDPDLELGGHPVSPLDWLRAGGTPDIVVSIATEL